MYREKGNRREKRGGPSNTLYWSSIIRRAVITRAQRRRRGPSIYFQLGLCGTKHNKLKAEGVYFLFSVFLNVLSVNVRLYMKQCKLWWTVREPVASRRLINHRVSNKSALYYILVNIFPLTLSHQDEGIKQSEWGKWIELLLLFVCYYVQLVIRVI